MQITIAPRGSLDYIAGHALVRSRYRRFFAVDAEPLPDCFVVARPGRDTDGSLSACAALTFARRDPMLSERRLGRPIEAVIGAREGRVVERCTILEVNALASNEAAAENELIRSLPMLAWCLGRQFAFCTAPPRVRRTIDRLDMRFVVLRGARDRRPDANRQAFGSDYYGQQPVVGYTSTSPIATNFESGTGHHCFDGLAMPFANGATPARTHREAA